MKKYYIVNFGEVVSTAELLGEYEEIWEAKDDAFKKMGDGDMLVGFPLDVNAEYTDNYGYNTVRWENADDDEKAYLCKMDNSIDELEGLWYWSDDVEQDTTFYNSDGSRWN